MAATVKSIQQEALDKMLKEMNESHTGAEDAIHNWLCNQDDDLLAKGILKIDRTINGALNFCTQKASELKNGNVAMIDDTTVFSWVKEYFLLDKIDIKKVSAKVKISSEKSEPVEKKVKKKTDTVSIDHGEQLSLLDFL